MDKLQLIKSAEFGGVPCDFYGKDNEVFMTREQIGRALEYSDAGDAIRKIHDRHKDRLDKFSVADKLSGTDGKKYQTYLYTRKGIMEICRWSQQPKADAFMDWVWEVMDGLMTGKTKLVSMTDYQRLTVETRQENIKIRKAGILKSIADQCAIPEYKQVLHSTITEIITGQRLLPLPEAGQRTYSAEEIGSMFGISKQMVGRIANANGLKTDTYGKLFYDKAPGIDKQVESFRYFANVIPEFERILGVKSQPA